MILNKNRVIFRERENTFLFYKNIVLKFRVIHKIMQYINNIFIICIYLDIVIKISLLIK